jgi:hypothetical protein
METLSDELLVHVFSLVEPVGCNLAQLPLVCSHWRALTADEQLWSITPPPCVGP